MAVALGSKNIGDIVKIRENGVLADFIIIHKGLPSGMYDASCNGVWVLRKDCNKQALCWDENNKSDYENSTIRAWLENTYYNFFDSGTKSIIKQVKIPFKKGEGKKSGGVQSGTSGLLCHCFLISCAEACCINIGSKAYADGAPLSYFTVDTAKKHQEYKKGGRTGVTTFRTPSSQEEGMVCAPYGNTDIIIARVDYPYDTKTAMILDSNAIVNDDGSLTANTAPTTPASISVPASIQGGSTVAISWSASSDAQGNLEGYKVERSINSGAWSQIYQGGGTSTTNNVAYGTNTVMYRVKAYDSMGLESGYKTSANVTVINNTAPGTPQGITVPADVRGGSPLQVSWGPSADAENNLAGYELERSVDGGTWTQVYKNAQQSFTDNITFGWRSVAYRVRAYDAYNAYSGYATSEARAVDNNRPPQIACDSPSGSDLGVKGEGFSIAYTVTDPDNNTGDVTVTETLDGEKQREFQPELGAVNNFGVEGLVFQCLPNGQHDITVTASDGKLGSTHTLRFTKSVTSAMITLETPLEADDQITVCAIATSGHIPEDAQFRVLVTNNANDAEPKWENCTQLVKDGANYVFSNQTAENGYAFNFKITVSRGESGEGGYITSVQGGFQ